MTLPKCATAMCAILLAASASPAMALSTKECSAKYQAAKAAGTLGGKTWNEFRKTECAANAPAATTDTPKPAPAAEAAKEAAPAKPSTATAAPSGAVFPAAVSPKYAKESAGKARLHTCLDQYNANKPNNANSSTLPVEADERPSSFPVPIVIVCCVFRCDCGQIWPTASEVGSSGIREMKACASDRVMRCSSLLFVLTHEDAGRNGRQTARSHLNRASPGSVIRG